MEVNNTAKKLEADTKTRHKEHTFLSVEKCAEFNIYL